MRGRRRLKLLIALLDHLQITAIMKMKLKVLNMISFLHEDNGDKLILRIIQRKIYITMNTQIKYKKKMTLPDIMKNKKQNK